MTKTMLTRILLVIGITLGAFGVSTMSSAQEIQILDIITDKQLEELDIEIPAETPVGYNELIIDVYEDNDVVVSKRIAFCKEADGFINWNNKCEGPIEVDPEPQVVAIPASALQDESLGSVALISLAVVSLFGALVSALSGQSVRFAPSQVAGSLASSLRELAKSLRGSSPLIARITDDGAWLRTRVGHGSIALYLASAAVTMIGLNDIDSQALPLSTVWTIALLLVGALDALAALYGSVLYLLVILTTGGVSGSADLVVVSLFVLLVSFMRQLAQTLLEGFSTKTESNERRAIFSVKVALLAGLMTYFILELMSLVLNRDVEVINETKLIAVISAVLVFARVLVSTRKSNGEIIEEFENQINLTRGRLIDVLLATVLTVSLMKFFLTDTAFFWPTLILIVLIGLLGTRKAARRK